MVAGREQAAVEKKMTRGRLGVMVRPMNTLSLPPALTQQMRAYESRLRRMETLLAVGGAVVGFLSMYLLLFVLDRFYDTPRLWRLVLLVGGSVAVARFAQGWGRNWLWNRRSTNVLAQELGKHFRTLGDRLQGVLELAQSGALPANISPALCRAAMAQVATDAAKVDFQTAVPVRPTRRWGLAATGVLALAITPFLLVPKAAHNAAQRFLSPLAEIERYTFVSLEALPADLYVAHGEPFQMRVGLAQESAWKPGTVQAVLERQEPMTVDFQDHQALLSIPPQTKDGTLSLRVGDARKDISIHPLHRPELRQLTAQITPPAYLQLPATSKALPGSTADFLQGSSVALQATISRPLASAHLEGESAAPALTGASFLSAPVVIGETPLTSVLSWTDEHGLAPTQPYSLKMQPVKDAEPRIELQDLEPEMAILSSELLKCRFTATDDFGIKETWLGWTVFSTGPEREETGRGETDHQPGSPTSVTLEGMQEWSPLWHKIADDSVIELAAYTRDYFPDRAPSVSWKHTIYVLSPAKHAEKVRDRMDAVLKQLDDRIRDEERQLEESKGLSERKENLASEKATEDLKHLESGERQNAEQLEKLTAEMESVLKDALRNPEVPEATVSDWKKLGEQIQQDAQPPMAKAAEKLQKAAEASPPPDAPTPPPEDQRSKELAEAADNQKAALDAMKEAAKKMNNVNESLYARNFYNRLRHSAKQEHGVSADLRKLAKDTVGMTPEEIDSKVRGQFDSSAQQQDRATSEVESLVTDIGNFIARLPSEKYGTVHKEMEEKKVVAALAELAGLVRANLVLKSVGTAKQWGQQLDAWAEMLQDESQSGQGEGNSEIPPEMMKLLIALVRAAQDQDTLRDQTLALDARKWTTENFLDDAGQLSELQTNLAFSIADLREKTPIEEAKPLLEKVHELMTDAGLQLRSPQTDADTVGIQATIIELLVPPDKKGGKSSPQMAKMQQAARQLMAKAKSPGKGNNKGDSGMIGDRANGAAAQGKSGQRLVDQATGTSQASEWPAEFRDALQEYFNRVEAPEK